MARFWFIAIFCSRCRRIRSRKLHDPTGAGDTFAGGFMGYLAGDGRVNEQTLRRAMVYGSVLGSFTGERFGVDRLAP